MFKSTCNGNLIDIFPKSSCICNVFEKIEKSIRTSSCRQT